ncbi:MAG TPA: PQQ-binding-like beta-propeller repeat protein [Streptosporangiaceae bacterium]|jgi:outer membrane protein assembly factor BamB
MTRPRTWIAVAAVAVVAAAALVAPRLWPGGAKSAPGRSALHEAWRVRPGANPVGHATGLVSDGRRVVTIQEPLRMYPDAAPSRLTGYDGATGKRLWRTALAWTNDAEPVGGDGVVIIASGGKVGSPTVRTADYVALDSRTGKQRWRVKVARRTDPEPWVEAGDTQPVGALRDGVFYYADGHAVIGVDAATGAPRYRFTSTADNALAGPVAAGDRIAMIVRATGRDRLDQSVLLLSPDLRTSARVLRTESYGFGPERMAVSGDTVLAWSGRKVWALDARTGRTILPGRDLPPQAGAVAVVGRTILATGAKPGLLDGYDLRTGRRTWSIGTKVDGDTESPTVQVVGGMLLTVGDDVAIVDPVRGRRVFHVTTEEARSLLPGASFGGHAVAAAGRVVVYGMNGLIGYR